MCGIAGVLSPDGAALSATVDEQLRRLTHRGPDAVGAFIKPGVALAQNRLAIIDLVTGDPPIHNEDATVGAVLNGEIYNFRELRRRLEHEGHHLHTTGDTEVIAHLAEERDPVDIARCLEGMFAFAVWDEHRQRLVLGRDRVGKKPLYYWYSSDTFVFASEIKGVLAHPAVPRELDEEAIPAYVAFGYVPTPKTFYRGIVSLPPGHVLSLSPGGPVVVERYWRPPLTVSSSAPGHDLDLETAGQEVRTRLTNAVERRLLSDVPLGAFLSGGIDSSLIVALMAQLSDQPVSTFTIGFDDRDGFDERPYARMIAKRYKTDHHEFVAAPGAVDLVERLVWHHDQPFGDSSAVPTFLLNEMTRRHVTVALSGDGGDELFAGYERFAAALAMQRYTRLPSPVRAGAHRVIGCLPGGGLRGRVASAQRFVRHADLGMPDAYRLWLSFFSDRTRYEALPAGSDWAIRDFDRIWRESSGAPPLDRLLDLNLKTYLLDDLLVKADRMSMAHGLEVRSPFLDVDLLEFAFRLPPLLKARGFALKRVLKVAARGLLPDEVLGRRKKGFGVPLDRWFRGDLRTYVNEMLGSRRARVREHLAPEVIDRLLGEHAAGARENGQALWMLLTLEVFLRRERW